MSAEQTTGTASSYSRKYALNGLFLIDETEADADSQKPQQPTVDEVNAKIINAKNLSELQTLFLALPVNEQKLAFALKEQLKAVLK